MEQNTHTSLYQQLHKLSHLNSDEALDQLLSAIWQTRKTGLRDKPHFQSLLNLPSLSDLDPVLACLRSLTRKCASEDGFNEDDVVKLFPSDLPLRLRQSLLLSFHKHITLWRNDVSREQRSLPTTSASHHVTTPASCSNAPGALWPRHNDLGTHSDQTDVGASVPAIPENIDVAPRLLLPPLTASPAENLGILPRLKSMTWTMENCSSEATKRVAVITLKLQDYTKSHSGEIEVQFQLGRDTLEAMLRSMTYINDQLSGTVSVEPIKKKQKHSDKSC